MHSPMRFDAPSHSEKPRAGFTLIELLVVMSILSVLMLLATPSMGLLNSQSLTSAGNQMVDATTMARQNSISKNGYTAVVVKTQGSGAYTAYCILDLQKNDDGSYGAWQAVTPWQYLASGIIFSPTTPSATISSFLDGTSNIPTPLPSQFSFKGKKIDLNPGTANSETIVQIYQPNGAPLSATQSLRLRLSEGIVSDSGQITYKHASKGPDGQPSPANFYDIVIVRDTGHSEIERR